MKLSTSRSFMIAAVEHYTVRLLCMSGIHARTLVCWASYAAWSDRAAYLSLVPPARPGERAVTKPVGRNVNPIFNATFIVED